MIAQAAYLFSLLALAMIGGFGIVLVLAFATVIGIAIGWAIDAALDAIYGPW